MNISDTIIIINKNVYSKEKKFTIGGGLKWAKVCPDIVL
jgi:hypothetical protein